MKMTPEEKLVICAVTKQLLFFQRDNFLIPDRAYIFLFIVHQVVNSYILRWNSFSTYISLFENFRNTEYIFWI